MVETSHVNAGKAEDFTMPGMRELVRIRRALPMIIFQPTWGNHGHRCRRGDRSGHGGGDARLLRDVLIGAQDDPLGHAAGYVDGARSILTGIAANIAIKTGLPVNVRDLGALDALG